MRKQRAMCALIALTALATALVFCAEPTQAAPGCLIGQVWAEPLGRCQQCPYATVKTPNVDGADPATCESARLLCGTAEVAKSGSCVKCPATQVARDDVTCVDCPPGFAKVPYGIVGDAACKRTATTVCIPKPEVCNGKDDDCDGIVDEDLGSVTCGVGECKRTVPACAAGKPQVCKAGDPKAETCNGRDDDCDGQVDEGLGTISCGRGACANTVSKCIGGKAQTCKPKPPGKEVCDGVDNDCDGTVDEGFAPVVCSPCGAKLPGCYKGKLASCADVCAQPCCEDCHNYFTSKEVEQCFKSCHGCRDGDKCLHWSASIGDKVAEVACEEAAKACKAVPEAQGGGADSGRQVAKLQCFYASANQCTSRASSYAQRTTAPGTCSRFYSKGGGSCSAEQYKAKVKQLLGDMCHDISIGMALALP